MARLWPFVLGGVALGLDAYVIAGLLPDIAVSVGSSASATGLGVAAFTGSYAVAGPFLSGRAGQRPRSGLVWALAVFTVANVTTAMSPALWVFLLSRAVAGAAAGVYSPLSSAVAAVLTPVEQRGRALSLVLAGLAAGTVFGVPLGLLVAEHWGWRWTVGLIALVGGLALSGVVLGGRKLPAVPASKPSDRLRAVARPESLLVVLVTLLTATASLGLYTYVSLVLDDSALAGHPTLGIWVWGVGGAAGALLIGRFVDRARSTWRLTAVILSGLTVALVLVAVGGPAWVTGLALFVWGLCGWASLAPQQHALLALTPDDGATAVAANGSANYLGSALGALLGSAAVARGAGPMTLAWAAAGAALLALLLHVVRRGAARRVVAAEQELPLL